MHGQWKWSLAIKEKIDEESVDEDTKKYSNKGGRNDNIKLTFFFEPTGWMG